MTKIAKPIPDKMTGLTVAQAYRQKDRNEAELKKLLAKREELEKKIKKTEDRIAQAKCYSYEVDGVAIAESKFGSTFFVCNDQPFHERHASIYPNVKAAGKWGVRLMLGWGWDKLETWIGHGFSQEEARSAALNWIVRGIKATPKYSDGEASHG